MQHMLLSIPAIIIYAIIFIAIIISIVSNKHDKKTKKLIEEIENSSPFRKTNYDRIRPHNDPLARNKVVEKHKQEQLENGVTIYDPMGLDKKNNQMQVEIVGLAEPKGFWSRFVMSQKLEYIMARLHLQNSNKSSGFWTNLIKAQAASQGKGQGRGR